MQLRKIDSFSDDELNQLKNTSKSKANSIVVYMKPKTQLFHKDEIIKSGNNGIYLIVEKKDLSAGIFDVIGDLPTGTTSSKSSDDDEKTSTRGRKSSK